jgi:hypothetical protein
MIGSWTLFLLVNVFHFDRLGRINAHNNSSVSKLLKGPSESLDSASD